MASLWHSQNNSSALQLVKNMISNFNLILCASFKQFWSRYMVFIFHFFYNVQHLSRTINDAVKNLIFGYISHSALNKVSAKMAWKSFQN